MRAADMALADRVARREALVAEAEAGLALVGATAIEDRLQDGVPDTVETLIAAGVKARTRPCPQPQIGCLVACFLVA